MYNSKATTIDQFVSELMSANYTVKPQSEGNAKRKLMLKIMLGEANALVTKKQFAYLCALIKRNKCNYVKLHDKKVVGCIEGEWQELAELHWLGSRA